MKAPELRKIYDRSVRNFALKIHSSFLTVWNFLMWTRTKHSTTKQIQLLVDIENQTQTYWRLHTEDAMQTQQE